SSHTLHIYSHHLHPSLSLPLPPPPRPTLFPYTTLFRYHEHLAYLEYPNGGAVFSTWSVGWCSSLSYNNYSNNVSRITENVLRRRSEEHTSELQSPYDLVCRLLLEKKKKKKRVRRESVEM